PKCRSLTNTECLRNLGHCQTLVTEFFCSLGFTLGGSLLPSFVAAFFPGDLNTGGLALSAVFQFHFSQTQHDCGDHAPHWAIEFDLLRDDDDLEPPLAPVGQQIHSVTQTPGKAIQFPANHNLYLPVEDVGLKAVKLRAL